MLKRTITVRGVPEPTLRLLRQSAKASRRSLNSELLEVLDSASTNAVRRDSAIQPGIARKAASKKLIIGSDALSAFCRRHHIVWLAIFGSFARCDATPESDIDVAVEFESGRTPGLGIVTIAESLATVIGGHRVDLVTLRGLSPRMRKRVLATAKVLYGAR